MFIRLVNPYFEEVWEVEESREFYNLMMRHVSVGNILSVQLTAKQVVYVAGSSYPSNYFGEENDLGKGHILEVNPRNFSLVETWE